MNKMIFKFFLVFFILSLTRSLFAERYIALNGPVSTTRGASIKMGGSPDYIHWLNTNIKWGINENGCCTNDNILIQDLETAVQNGFNAWDTVSTALFDFIYEGFTNIAYGNDGHNTVYWAEENDPAFGEGGPLGESFSGSLAITIITTNDREEILDADIVFNGRDHKWKTNNSDPDIWAVTAHEAGHLLGLFHSEIQSGPVADLPTMIYYYNSLYYRDLSFDDRVGVSFLYGGNLIDNENFQGKIYLKWSVNILPGKNLTIQPGTILKMFKGASIKISGELTSAAASEQKIIFQGYANSTWDGIFFHSGSKGIMNYCIIAGVSVSGGGALTIYDSSPGILNCTIENNSGYCSGICVINNASPEIQGNTIRNNSLHGIYIYNANPLIISNKISGSFAKGTAAVYCDYHSSPVFGNASLLSQGNNILTGSYYGLYATNSSMPCAGEVNFACNNIIYDNYYADAYAENNSIIYARNNYWGKELKLNSDKGSHIYFKPYLISGSQLLHSKSNYNEESQENSSVTGSEEAKKTFLELLTGIYNNAKYDDQTEDNLLKMDYGEESTTKYIPLVFETLSGLALKKKLYDKLMRYSEILISEYKNTIHEKNGYMLQFFNFYNQSQWSSARNIIEQLYSRFPDDENILLASWLLNSETDNPKSGAESEIMSTSEDYIVLAGYSLSQNYPNPFNPSTKIEYTVKSEGLITITVYDILGSEIEVLTKEEKPAGTYELDWNAANLPSGVYLYTMQAGYFTETKKMILLK